MGPLAPRTGVSIGDGWWVNGRTRSLLALYAVEGSSTSKTLPDPPRGVAAILAGFGKPRRTAQFVPPALTSAQDAVRPVPPEIALISPIVGKYRSGMKALVDRIGLPHDLPPAAEARLDARGASGPLKPALVQAFSQRGYDCRGGSGTFTLRRRTSKHHVVDVELDVGTWSRSLTFMFRVRGPGSTRRSSRRSRHETTPASIQSVTRPTGRRSSRTSPPSANELDRTFVPEIEAAVGPAPEWFEPGRE